MQELNISLNKNIAGEFDWDILANEFKIPELKEWGFEEFELGGLIEFLPKNNALLNKLFAHLNNLYQNNLRLNNFWQIKLPPQPTQPK
mgnify:CR=1 FL=1